MDLVLFGIQGSGKGTQAKKLAEEFGYDIVEMGGELRKIIATGSILGKTVASFIDKGNHAPLEIVMEVLKKAVLARPKDQKILFDGIPRNPEQQAQFDLIMQEAGRPFRCVQLTIPRDIAIARITGRAAEQNRPDDADPVAVARRLDLFMEKTLPVILHYKEQGNMIDIDGTAPVEEVYEKIKKAIE